VKLNAAYANAARRDEGDWVTEIPEMQDLHLRVRGTGNADYRLMQENLLKSVPKKERRAGLLPATQDRILAELAVENLLLDWRNLTDNDDAAIPYSKEKARELLFNPNYHALLMAVAWAATVVAEEDAEADEADVQD
jgi:hypothetical protein